MTQYDVLLIGRNPIAAVLAGRLANAGRAVALIDDGMAPATSGLVRWITLRDLPLGDRARADDWPSIQSFTERTLLEDGHVQTEYRSECLAERANRFLVTESPALVDLIVGQDGTVDQGTASARTFLRNRGRVTGVRFADGSEIDAHLTLVTSDNRLLLGAKDESLPDDIASPFVEHLEIVWAAESENTCDRVRYRGGQLADVRSTATLLSTPSRIVLSLMAPAADLVRESIVMTDLLARFLGHRSLSDLSPLSSALSASVRLLMTPERVNLEQYGPGFAIFGSLEGLCDTTSFDREIMLARAIADELVVVPPERLGSVAAIGTAVAGVRGSRWARRVGRIASTQEGDILVDPDRLAVCSGFPT